MSTKDNGGPAFPAHHFDLAENEHGMTLRDYFAAKAMPEIYGRVKDGGFDRVAKLSYECADAMMKARSQ